MRMSGSKTRVLALTLTGVAVAALVGCASAGRVDRAPAVAEPVAAETPAVQDGVTHGAPADMFPLLPGISLDEALRTMKPQIILPPASVVGGVTKAVFSGTDADDQGNPGLTVRYDSGIELEIMHGERDLAALAAENNSVPMKDGRTQNSDLQNVSGRQLLVTRSGVTGGPESRVAGYKIMSSVTWNMDSYLYIVFARSDSVTMGDLMKVANSIRERDPT